MASGQLYMHTSLDLGDIWKYRFKRRVRIIRSGIYSRREDDGGQDVRNTDI